VGGSPAYEERLRSFVDDTQAGARSFVSVFATKSRLGIAFRSLTDNLMLPEYPM
jgi:hypothetical protein